MSGIYIKGVEMPTNCYVCPFCDYVSARCDAVKGTPYTPTNRYEVRADWCPLVSVPDHGRLIDADALSEMLEKYKTEYALKAKEDITYLHKAWGLYEAELMSESLPDIIPADPAREGKG